MVLTADAASDYRHLLDADEDFEWLELEPEDVPKPFRPPLSSKQFVDSQDPATELLKMMMMPDYLSFATQHLLNVELLPFQAVILDELWNKKFPILVASRGAGKTFILAVYALLRLTFHPGAKIVIVSASFRQSKAMFDYMVDIWDNSPILRDFVGYGIKTKDKKSRSNGPKREIDRCEFRVGRSVAYAIPIGDGTKIRGLRANFVLADEKASIPKAIFDVVVKGFGVVALSPGLQAKKAASVRKMKKMGIWTPELQEISDSESQGNQVVLSGTASFEFNDFYTDIVNYEKIIRTGGDQEKIKAILGSDQELIRNINHKDFCIMSIPYNVLPEGFMDTATIAQNKATMHPIHFGMEYCARFSRDSEGFYRRSVIEAATTHSPITLSSGEKVQFVALKEGRKECSYVMGVDPAAEVDNAAIVLLENHGTHRRIVYCWTVNRERFTELKRLGVTSEDDYFRFLASKIRSLMSRFNIVQIVMDKGGGGVSVAEALGSRAGLGENEHPIYEIVDPKEPKYTDELVGLHLVNLVKPSSEYNAHANHGLLSDLQTKTVLFPHFDTVEIEKQLLIEAKNNIEIDTYEDVVIEIEELKFEMTTIVVTSTSKAGHENFDTPSVKAGNDAAAGRKGRLRKDRYSALLMANAYCRGLDKTSAPVRQYEPVGGTKYTLSKTAIDHNEPMYFGLEGIEGVDFAMGTSVSHNN